MYAQTLTVVDLIVVICWALLTLLEKVFFRFRPSLDTRQPHFSLNAGDKTGPYLDQGGSKT